MRRVVVLVALISFFGWITIAPAHADVQRGDTGTDVKQVQEHLRWYGYSVATDGVFGPQTAKAVKHFQRSSGLTVDGIVGPVTAGALGIRGEQQQLTAPPAAPALTGCDEMQAYRIAAGLPEQFDAIGYRESRCRNDVGNYCCHAWWANYLSSHLSKQSAYRDRIINDCDVTTVDDIRGLSDAQKRASACVTYVVWSISGMSPWKATS